MLSREEVAAELICDGFHVHPGDRANGHRGEGRREGHGDHRRHGRRRAADADRRRGWAARPIRVRDQAALLEDGTLAGST